MTAPLVVCTYQMKTKREFPNNIYYLYRDETFKSHQTGNFGQDLR